MKDEFKEIPARLWEDYVQFRDRMTVLEEMGIDAPDSVNREWAELKTEVNKIESNFDYEQLRERYDESLTKGNK